MITKPMAFVLRKKKNIVKPIENYLLNLKKSRINIAKQRNDLLRFLSNVFNVDAQGIYTKYVNSDFKSWYDSRNSELIEIEGATGTASDFDCDTLYLLVRSLKPRIIIETGVLYGGSSSHILEAIRENGFGRLYSIDLPNYEQSLPKDFLVRRTAKHNWELIVGDVRLELPKLLRKIGPIDLFFHDSEHSFDHMLWEYETARKHLLSNGVLVSHDVLSAPFRKNVFKVFCETYHLRNVVFRNLGICLMK